MSEAHGRILSIRLNKDLIVNDFAEMFAKDNDRFDVNRFHEASGYHVPKFTSR